MKIDKAKIKKPISQNKRKSVNQRVSTYTESYKGEYYNIEISKLTPFKEQSREIFDRKDLEDLAKTIKAHGIRQPLTVLPSEEKEGMYEIVSGERRWKAAQIVGLQKVPCIILQDKNTAEEIALIENVQRRNLHPLELMKGFHSLLKKGVCKSQQEISDKIGISRTIVVETMALNNLPHSTQKLLLNNNLKSRDVLRKLLKTPEKEHVTFIENITKEKKQSFETKAKTPSKKKHKIFAVYLDSEEIMFDENVKTFLTLEQKSILIKRLEGFIEAL